MRATLLIASVILHASVSHGTELKPFTTDGCSRFPEGTVSQQALWLDCCLAHDAAYWAGGTAQQREEADIELKRCVANKGEQQIAQLMLLGVRMGGSAFWPTAFRWGYGWPYLRGYQELDAMERQAIKHDWPVGVAMPAYLQQDLQQTH